MLSEGFKIMDFGGYKVQNSDLCNKFKEESEMHDFFTSTVGEPISHGDRRTYYLARESEEFEKFLKKEKSVVVDGLKISNYNSSSFPKEIEDSAGNKGIFHTYRPPNPFKFSCLNVWREIDNVVVPDAARSVNYDSEKLKQRQIVYVNEVKRNDVDRPFKKIEIYKFKCEELKDNRADWLGNKALKPFNVEPGKYLLLLQYIVKLSKYTGRFLKNDEQKKLRQMIDVLKCNSLRHLEECDWEKINFENLTLPPARKEFEMLFGTESASEWMNAWNNHILPLYLFKTPLLAVC